MESSEGKEEDNEDRYALPDREECKHWEHIPVNFESDGHVINPAGEIEKPKFTGHYYYAPADNPHTVLHFACGLGIIPTEPEYIALINYLNSLGISVMLAASPGTRESVVMPEDFDAFALRNIAIVEHMALANKSSNREPDIHNYHLKDNGLFQKKPAMILGGHSMGSLSILAWFMRPRFFERATQRYRGTFHVSTFLDSGKSSKKHNSLSNGFLVWYGKRNKLKTAFQTIFGGLILRLIFLLNGKVYDNLLPFGIILKAKQAGQSVLANVLQGMAQHFYNYPGFRQAMLFSMDDATASAKDGRDFSDKAGIDFINMDGANHDPLSLDQPYGLMRFLLFVAERVPETVDETFVAEIENLYAQIKNKEQNDLETEKSIKEQARMQERNLMQTRESLYEMQRIRRKVSHPSPNFDRLIEQAIKDSELDSLNQSAEETHALAL